MLNYRYLAFLASFWSFSLARAVLETPFGQHVDHCPNRCTHFDPIQSGWSQLHHLEDLEQCDQPFLFTFNLQNLIDNPDTLIAIQACSQVTGEGDSSSLAEVAREASSADPNTTTNRILIENNCGAETQHIEATAQLRPASTTAHSLANTSDISLAVSQLAAYLQTGASCGTTVMFAKAGDTVIGLYSGAEVQKASATALTEIFQGQAQNGTRMVQVCEENVTAARTLGLFAGSMVDIEAVQGAVKTWANSQCLNGEGSTPIEGLNLNLLVSSVKPGSTGDSRSTNKILHRRAECRDIQVLSGDSCASLATRCGITGAQFTKFNPAEDLCSTLKPKQYVCCSAGDLPDHSPQPGADGSCYTYTVQATDNSCWDIANSFGIEVSVIENNNDNTWGWAGCSHLQKNQAICLSKGNPPFPNSFDDATCGPQVPGTVKPTDGTAFAELNPCPLNACCDAWGSCGVTEEFCTPAPADTGAPGSAQPGTNGCISNCGTDIVNNDDGPASFRRVGYFEAWNGERPCLHMKVSEIDTSELTHIHFAFATVTEDWQVSINEVKDKFQEFTKLDRNVKKIVAFGGWAFSTGDDTFQRFRDATKPENREAFAASAVAFLEDNDLDGLDFDWEYPGAPDIPGIPPGSAEEGENYLEFLKLIRGMMPEEASLSIALPSSYWYLKQYPVDKMQNHVDYFVYMTYDFHGQWDVGNEFSTPGCKGGNCLRSHVNITETTTSLAMITKAGVQANKLLVGITSYGRSFRMSDSSCSGPMCTYTGTNTSSNAYPGRCTETSGYISNAEIVEIIDKPGDYSLIETSYDASSDSNILIYGTKEKADWLAYMDRTTKKSRVNWVKDLNFGGATDWAVDLMEFVGDGDDGSDDDGDMCESTYKSHDMPEGNHMPWHVMDPEWLSNVLQYVTIVNLTPHRFVLESTHSYQIDPFEFGDIPPGHALQNIVQYSSDVDDEIVDDNGEAYYNIEGTDKKFVVRATTHIPGNNPMRTVFDLSGMGLGQREYKDPQDEASVTLVITGSDSYGFIASLGHGPGNWMNAMKDIIGDRKIQHVVMPGTHDSGMSSITHAFLSGGIASNTQTQALNIYNQLLTGARWFDMRIGSVHDIDDDGGYSFWSMHVADETADVVLGNTGQSLKDIIQDVNRFTDENPGEVIFFSFRYLVGIRHVPSRGPILWNKDIMDHFFNALTTIRNRCPDLDSKPFNEQPASYFMNRNLGAGCVVLLLNGENLEDDVSHFLAEEGIYATGRMDVSDNWSDMMETDDVVSDQIKDWKANSRNDDMEEDKFFISQWLVTADFYSSTFKYSIEKIAIYPTNPALYWAGVNGMSPKSWPTVLMVDYIGLVLEHQTDWDSLSAELYTLAVGLNLYMVSENCEINSGRSPLQKPSSDKATNRLISTWNGVTFANGTTIDHPPPNLHPGRVEILRSGTVFNNGTVLETDIPNPNFNSTSF